MLLFDGSSTLANSGMRKSARWQHDVGSGYIGMYEYSGGLTYGGLRIVKLANDGTVEHTWHNGMSHDHYEPRSFDVFTDGNTFSIAEAGGSTYIMHTNSSGSILDIQKLHSPGIGNGFMYGWCCEAIQYTPSFLASNDRYAYYGGSITNGGAFRAYVGMAVSNGQFSSHFSQGATTDSNTTVYNFRMINKYAAANNTSDVITLGRTNGAFNSSSFVHRLDSNLSSISNPIAYDIGQYNDTDQLYDACWHNRPYAITNSNSRWHATGYTSNTSSYQAPTIIRGENGGIHTGILRSINRVNGTNTGGEGRGIEYDHINGNRVYVVGAINKPNDSTSTVKDGFVACLNVTDDATTVPTIEWAIAVEQLDNGTKRSVRINSLCVDDEGCPIVSGNYANASQADRIFALRLPSDSALTGTVNVSSGNNLNIYDATSLLSLNGHGQQNQTIGNNASISWSKTTQVGTSGSTTFTNTLVKI